MLPNLNTIFDPVECKPYKIGTVYYIGNLNKYKSGSLDRGIQKHNILGDIPLKHSNHDLLGPS
jgi:hypothetical protein